MRIHRSNLCSSERWVCRCFKSNFCAWLWRSEEHTSELQSRLHLVCRLLLEKKKENSVVITIFGVKTRISDNYLSTLWLAIVLSLTMVLRMSRSTCICSLVYTRQYTSISGAL